MKRAIGAPHVSPLLGCSRSTKNEMPFLSTMAWKPKFIDRMGCTCLSTGEQVIFQYQLVLYQTRGQILWQYFRASGNYLKAGSFGHIGPEFIYKSGRCMPDEGL